VVDGREPIRRLEQTLPRVGRILGHDRCSSAGEIVFEIAAAIEAGKPHGAGIDCV
jgi:hypothetical protein